MNSLQELRRLGQSIWLDYIRRDLITSGELGRMVKEDGVTGITSNPTIFGRALASGDLYDQSIREAISANPNLSSGALFEYIEVQDLQMAADILRPVYDRSNGGDGFVSIEVSPYLAYDTEGTIAEARRLWSQVDRRNLMVKVPATAEGFPAIEALTAGGINVNITLMFSVMQYAKVAHAYLHGIERNVQPEKVTSVASFFVSRVDTAVDRALEEIGTEEALSLRGKAAIANATLAYRAFRMIFSSDEFRKLQTRGVRLQKPLWASAGTKNKAYSDVMYVESLIAPDTINSMPPETLKAFREHGKARVSLGQNDEQAEEVQGRLLALGISLRSIGQELTHQGIDKFKASYDELIAVLDEKRASVIQPKAA